MTRFRVAWPAPDFVPRRNRPPPVAWVLLVVGVATLALAVADLAALNRQRDEALQGLARWQRQALPPVHTVAVAAPDAAAVRTARAIARSLQYPWRDVLLSAEAAAAPGVQWLRLEHDAERGDVRLEGVAPGAEAVLRSLEALTGARGWHDVTLTRTDGGAGAVDSLRFELRARHGAPAAQAPTP